MSADLLSYLLLAAVLVVPVAWLLYDRRRGARGYRDTTAAEQARGSSAPAPPLPRLPDDLDLRGANTLPWDHLIYLPAAAPPDVTQVLLADALEGVPYEYPWWVRDFRVYAVGGGGTVVDVSRGSADGALDDLRAFVEQLPEASRGAHAWITIRHEDLALFVDEGRAIQLTNEIDRAADLHRGQTPPPKAQLDGLTYEEAAYAHRLLPSGPGLGTRLLATPAAEEGGITLVTARGHAYDFHPDDFARATFEKAPLELRTYVTPLDVWRSAQGETAPDVELVDSTPVPAWLAARFTELLRKTRGSSAPVPTEIQLEAARSGGDGLIAVSLSAKRTYALLAEDSGLAGLLDTGTALQVASLGDGRTAVRVEAIHGLPVLARVFRLLQGRLTDATPTALEAWGTAQGTDHLLSGGRLAAGVAYRLVRPPSDGPQVLICGEAGTTLAWVPSEKGGDFQSTTDALAYRAPTSEIAARALASVDESPGEPSEDDLPIDAEFLPPLHYPRPAADDREIVLTQSLTQDLATAVEGASAGLAPAHRPRAERHGPLTRIRFPTEAALAEVAAVLDGLARTLRLGPEEIGGFGTFTAEDTRDSTDQQRVTATALARHDTWLAAAGERAPDAALSGFAEALLPFDGPRLGTGVYLYPVRSSTERDPVVGLTDALGIGYRYFLARVSPQLRWVQVDVRAYRHRPEPTRG